MKRPGHALLLLGVLIVFIALATAVFGQSPAGGPSMAPLSGASGAELAVPIARGTLPVARRTCER